MQNDLGIRLAVEGLNRYEADLNSASNATKKAAGGMSDTLKGLAGAIGVTFGAAAAADLLKNAAKSAMAYETLGVQFEVFLGSAEKAQTVLADLNKFSIETPFTPDEVNASGRALLGLGIEAKELIPSLKTIGNLAAGVGIPFEELAVSFGKAMGAGIVQNDILNQFQDRGINVLKELGKMYGKTTLEVKKMGEQNLISSEDFKKALEAMSGEGGKFNGMMDKMSQSTEGLISTIEGKLQDELRGIGQAMLPTIRIIAEGFEPAFKSVKDAFIAVYTPMADALSGIGDLLSMLNLGGTSGNKFANIVGTIASVLKVLTIPAQLVWKAIGLIIDGFKWIIGGVSSVVSSIGQITSVFDLALVPLKAFGAAWDYVFGKAEQKAGLAASSLAIWNKAVDIVKDKTKATNEELWNFQKSFDMAKVAGKSADEAIKIVTTDLAAFLKQTRGAADGLTGGGGGKGKGLAPALKEVAKEMDYLKSKDILEALGGEKAKTDMERFTLEATKMHEALTDVADKGQRSLSILGDAFDPGKVADQMEEGLPKINKATAAFAEAFKGMADQVKGYMVNMAADVAFNIGEAIGSGASVGQVFKQALRDLAVQVPKLVGMALLNQAAGMGPSPIALGMAVAGLALIGASGIASGLFKAADKRNEARVANNSGAAASTNSDTGQATGFASVIGDQIANSMDGRRLVLQVGDQEMDAYVYDSNRRNAESRGR